MRVLAHARRKLNMYMGKYICGFFFELPKESKYLYVINGTEPFCF